MKANEQVLRKLNQDNAAETWEVDTVGNCGLMFFPKVITVFEPKSKNPGIAINGEAMGLRGLKKAIALVEAERAKIGLTTLE